MISEKGKKTIKINEILWQKVPIKAVVQKQPANAPLACVTQVPLFWQGFGKQPFCGAVVVVVVTELFISHNVPE